MPHEPNQPSKSRHDTKEHKRNQQETEKRLFHEHIKDGTEQPSHRDKEKRERLGRHVIHLLSNIRGERLRAPLFPLVD